MTTWIVPVVSRGCTVPCTAAMAAIEGPPSPFDDPKFLSTQKLDNYVLRDRMDQRNASSDQKNIVQFNTKHETDDQNGSDRNTGGQGIKMVRLNDPSTDPSVRGPLAVIGGIGPRNPYYFTGRRLDFDERDANGDSLLTLYHYRARAYDPVHGRFLQRDPAGYIDSMNLYEYVSSRPTTRVDPTGKIKLDLWFAAFIPNKIGKPAHKFGKNYANLDGTWFDEPFGTSWIVSTDNRGFGRTKPGLSRIKSKATIESKNIGRLREGVNYFTTESDITKRAAVFPFGDFAFVDTAKSRPTSSGTVKNISPCKSVLTIRASGGYPFAEGLLEGFGAFVPNIDYTVKFTLEKKGNRVYAIVSGQHNLFPSYEAFVGVRRLHSYDALKYGFNNDGPGFINLNSSEDFDSGKRMVVFRNSLIDARGFWQQP